MFIILSNKLDKKTAGKVVVKGTEYNELSDVGMELGKPGLFGNLFPGLLGAIPDFIGGIATAITNDWFGDRTEYSARYGFDGAFFLGRVLGHSVQAAVGALDMLGAVALMVGNMAAKGTPATAIASVAVSAEVKTVAVGLGAYGYKTVDEAVAAIKGDYAMYSKTKGSGGKTQLHHVVTDKNKKFNFKKHPAIKESGINISKDKDNLIDLENHSGRHTEKYHKKIWERLDIVHRKYGGDKVKLEKAVRDELKKMKDELVNGTLDPYEK